MTLAARGEGEQEVGRMKGVLNAMATITLVWIVALFGYPLVALGISSVFVLSWCWLAHSFRQNSVGWRTLYEQRHPTGDDR